MLTERTESGRAVWKADKSGGSSNCVTHLETFAGHGDEARATSTWMRNDSRAEGNSAKKAIGEASPSYFAYANVPWKERREKEREFRRQRAPTEGETVSVKISAAGSFDQYFNERIIGINGSHRLSDLAPISNRRDALSAASRFLAFCLDETA